MAQLTPTSYAVLGLLCERSWSGYELAQEVERSWRFVWPRARSGIYEEPRKLVERGLATAATTPRGERGTRTVYSVTAKGRRTFRAWLAEPSAEPRFESEALVRALFADQGTEDELFATLTGLREQAAAWRTSIAAQAQDSVDATSPLDARRHLLMLVARFAADYAVVVERWAAWAEAEVATWPDVTDAASVPDLDAKLGALAAVAPPTPGPNGDRAG